MPDEQKERREQRECRVTVRVEGAEECCVSGDAGAAGKQRLIKINCCPVEEK